jgi:branched-chain amino acid aminotransferase
VDTLAQECVETVAANDLLECYIRPIVVRTGEQMGIYPVDLPAETFIIAWRWGRYLGDDALETGVDVGVSSWRRPAPDTIPALAKAGGNYLGSQLSKIEARVNRYSEGIVLDTAGLVAEGSGENVFLVRGGVLYTPPLACGILQGITRDSVMRIARDLGVEVREEAIPREMLYIADELFFSGTAAELTPIRSVDRIQVSDGKPGPVTLAIQEQFMGMATGKIEDRYGWLTPVGDAVTALR